MSIPCDRTLSRNKFLHFCSATNISMSINKSLKIVPVQRHEQITFDQFRISSFRRPEPGTTGKENVDEIEYRCYSFFKSVISVICGSRKYTKPNSRFSTVIRGFFPMKLSMEIN